MVHSVLVPCLATRSRFLRFALVSVTPLLIPTLASAAPFTVGGNLYDVQYVAGTGANSALLDIDFGTKQVLFGFQWDGTAYGFDMLHSVDLASTDFFVGGQQYSFGYFVKTITYKTDSLFTTSNFSSYVEYFNSTDGVNWTLPEVGASDRVLTDGAIDAWIESPADSPASLAAGSAVPEPASLGLLALGGLALLRRRGR